MIKTSLAITAFFLMSISHGFSADAIQCANLIYGGTHTSRCFSDQFLTDIQRKTGVQTERRFKSVKLGSDELFSYPFVVVTGEEDFSFTASEVDNLRRYLLNGGFMLASAGCSSKRWADSFKRNLRRVFKDDLKLQSIPMDHPVFNTVYSIDDLELSKSSGTAELEGIIHNGRLVLVFSPHGLNDTGNSDGCCCCGGNEIRNAIQVNVNILMYALMH